jgi:hypothetical protein
MKIVAHPLRYANLEEAEQNDGNGCVFSNFQVIAKSQFTFTMKNFAHPLRFANLV